MVKYIKTEISEKAVIHVLVYYLKMCKCVVILPNKTTQYIKDIYSINTDRILDKMISNVNVIKVDPDLLSIEILDEKINKTTLKSLVNLIEYGNRDIPASGCISKMFNKAIELTKDSLGGI